MTAGNAMVLFYLSQKQRHPGLSPKERNVMPALFRRNSQHSIWSEGWKGEYETDLRGSGQAMQSWH